MKHVMAGGEALGPEEPTRAGAEKATANSRLPVEEAWENLWKHMVEKWDIPDKSNQDADNMP